MTTYPIREPFLNLHHGDMLYDYRMYCQKRFKNQATLDDIKENLEEIYTPLNLNSGYKSYKVEEALCTSQFLAISGVAGSGKSTITKFLSLILVQNGVNYSISMLGKRIVMPIILRELSFDKIHSFDELLEAWIENINNNYKKQLLQESFLIFISKMVGLL